jgi:hypothetical protein
MQYPVAYKQMLQIHVFSQFGPSFFSFISESYCIKCLCSVLSCQYITSVGVGIVFSNRLRSLLYGVSKS